MLMSLAPPEGFSHVQVDTLPPGPIVRGHYGTPPEPRTLRR
jgi:hypothetical protein